MSFKDKMKIQIKNWRWWLTLPITVATLLAGTVVAAVGLAVYIGAFIVEIVMASMMLAFHEVAVWRNKNIALGVKPVKFDGLLVKI